MTLTVNFDASASTAGIGETITSYEWDFGDETGGTGETPQHTYDAAGQYIVLLTVTNSAGITDTESGCVCVSIPGLCVNFGAAKWTEDQDMSYDDITPAAGIEEKSSIDLAKHGYKRVMVQVTVAFGDAADGDAEIRVRSSSNSGVTKDTVLLHSFLIPFAVSTTKTVSFMIDEVPYVEVGIYNGNAAAQTITISAVYAGLKYKGGISLVWE